MNTHYLDSDAETVIETVLADASGELYLITPARSIIESAIPAIEATDGISVRLLTDESVLKDVLGGFILASTAADLLADGRLTLRTIEEPPNTLVVSDTAVTAIVSAGETVAGLVTDDTEFVDAAREQYRNEWSAGEPFNLRTPPLSRVRETLADDLGKEAAATFDSVLEALDTARGDGDGLDEVTICLLVAARHGILLYDLSKWAEDIGLASKATFSRVKNRLEERGLIETEKVPVDIGRPRQRLVLDDERLQTASPDELASVTQRLLTD